MESITESRPSVVIVIVVGSPLVWLVLVMEGGTQDRRCKIRYLRYSRPGSDRSRWKGRPLLIKDFERRRVGR